MLAWVFVLVRINFIQVSKQALLKVHFQKTRAYSAVTEDMCKLLRAPGFSPQIKRNLEYVKKGKRQCDKR